MITIRGAIAPPRVDLPVKNLTPASGCYSADNLIVAWRSITNHQLTI
jgi:hypothetical protein